MIFRFSSIRKIDCTGSFGTCTQEDKTRLGYLGIKKLHSQMDEDHDGGIEVHETKDVFNILFYFLLPDVAAFDS